MSENKEGKKLVSLSDWDASRRQAQPPKKPRPNGIACPKCGCELLDTDSNVTLASNPPRRPIHCDACGYAGSRAL